MKKPSVNAGETVKEVREEKDAVNILFTDGKSIVVSMGAYLDGPRIYPGKKLDKSLISRLSSSKSDIMLYSYLISLLSSGRLYSRKKLISKLMDVKKASFQEANELVLKAVQQGLIDDGEFIRQYILAAYEKGQQREKILSDLAREGYKDDKPKAVYDSLGLDENADRTALESLKSVPGRNIKTKIANASNRLVKKGFSPYEAQEKIKACLERDPGLEKSLRESELKNLKEEYGRMMDSFLKSGLEEEEAQKKTLRRLLSHLYAFDDIIKEQEARKTQ